MTTSESAISPLEIKTSYGDLISIFEGASEIPGRKHSYRGFHSLHGSGDFGLMKFHHLPGKDFMIWYSEYHIARDIDFITLGDIPLLELSIPLSANIHSAWDRNPEIFVQNQQFELSYIPFVNNFTRFKKDNFCRTFDIHYSREYLDRFASEYRALGDFLEKVDRKEPASFNGRNHFLSPDMLRLVGDMLAYNMADKLASYFFEASALLMLTMVLDRLETPAGNKSVRYSEHERESVTEAKNLILADFSEKYSIRELARKTGTSESRLQLAFRHFYGTTLFDYAQSARLEYAKMLLLDTSISIQSIAEQCGYPDNSNLSAAFKKRFGSSPEVYRTKGR